jgi:hypothetical protein
LQALSGGAKAEVIRSRMPPLDVRHSSTGARLPSPTQEGSATHRWDDRQCRRR